MIPIQPDIVTEPMEADTEIEIPVEGVTTLAIGVRPIDIAWRLAFETGVGSASPTIAYREIPPGGQYSYLGPNPLIGSVFVATSEEGATVEAELYRPDFGG